VNPVKIKLQRFVGFYLDEAAFKKLRIGTRINRVSVSNALRVLIQRWLNARYRPGIKPKEMDKFAGPGRPLGKE
jgi:hypothetical protein